MRAVWTCVHVRMCVCTPVLAEGEGKSNQLTSACYLSTMEYYSAIKKNTFESILMRWMKLEPIIQSDPAHTRTLLGNVPKKADAFLQRILEATFRV